MTVYAAEFKGAPHAEREGFKGIESSLIPTVSQPFILGNSIPQ